MKKVARRRSGISSLSESKEEVVGKAISELRLESSGAVSKLYTVGNMVEYSRETPIDITIHPLNEPREKETTEIKLDITAATHLLKEVRDNETTLEMATASSPSGDEDHRPYDSGWSSPPVTSRPPRPSLPLASRPSLNSPSLLLSPSEEDPSFLLLPPIRRRSKYELPEIVETPEDDDRGIRMFLQRRRSIDCKVRQSFLRGPQDILKVSCWYSETLSRGVRTFLDVRRCRVTFQESHK